MKNHKMNLLYPIFMFLMGLSLLAGCEKERYEKSELDNEQEITIHQVPAAVKATIQQENSGKVPSEIEMLTKNGKTVYAVRLAKNGKEEEVYISEDGKIVQLEDREQEEKDDDD